MDQTVGSVTADKRKVYLMDVREYTKIGYATDPKARRSVVQSHNFDPVKLAAVIPTDDAKRLERKLHSLLSPYRVDGGGGREWFDLPDDIHKALVKTRALTPDAIDLRLEDGYEPDDPLLYLDQKSARKRRERELRRESEGLSR